MLTNMFFCSSGRRHTRCALVTGVQTCALPISIAFDADAIAFGRNDKLRPRVLQKVSNRIVNLRAVRGGQHGDFQSLDVGRFDYTLVRQRPFRWQIGRASCRERVWTYVMIWVGRGLLQKKTTYKTTS